MSLDVNEERIASWPPDAQAFVRLLLAEVAALRAEVAELRAENREPRMRLEQHEGPKTTQNSSLPPGTQYPHAAHLRKPASKRRPVCQPGHRKFERPLIPVKEYSETKVLKSRKYRRCGSGLLVAIRPHCGTRSRSFPRSSHTSPNYQPHRREYPCCSETTCAALPAGAPVGQTGPRLMVFTALLVASLRQSKRRTSLFLGDLLGQPCSPALTVKIQNEGSKAREALYQETRAALPGEKRVFMDESPRKKAGEKAWLWAVVTPLYAVHPTFPSRAGTAVDQLPGSTFSGFVNCDRATMHWRVEQLQWCWSHLKRDFQAPDRQP